MKLRVSLAAAGAAVALAITGALLVPAMASAHSGTHTLKFFAVAVKSITFTKSTGAQQDTDVSAGKAIGFDELNYTVTGETTATADIAFDLNGGFLYCALHLSLLGPATGKVTGGTGRFSGANGKFYGKPEHHEDAITITYSR
jgi:hypothetical protein